MIYVRRDPDGTLKDQSNELPPALWHEIALIYMEEWVHLLQEISGSLLTDAPDSEIDVANFFEIHGIPMTEAFLERYHRGEYLEKKKK